MEECDIIPDVKEEEEKRGIGPAIIPVKKGNLQHIDHFTNNFGEMPFQRILIGVVRVDAKTGKVMGGADEFEEVPATNADITWAPTQAKVRVRQVAADMDCNAAVANRVLTLSVTKAIAGVALVVSHITGGVTLSADQNGSITMIPGSETTYLNDNGTITDEDTAITGGDGMILEVGDTVLLASTNKDAGDRLRMQIKFEVDEE